MSNVGGRFFFKFLWLSQNICTLPITILSIKNKNLSKMYAFLIQLPEKSVSNEEKTLSMMIPSCAVGLAYLWETTPVLGTKALPLYADDMFELPGAPWIKEVGPL